MPAPATLGSCLASVPHTINHFNLIQAEWDLLPFHFQNRLRALAHHGY